MGINVSLDLIGIFLIAVIIANSLLGFIIFFNNKDRNELNRTYFLLTIAIDAWVFSMFMFRALTNTEHVYLFSILLYGLFTFVPITFYYFSASFFKQKVTLINKIIINTLFLISFLIVFIPNTLIKGVELRTGSENAIFFGEIASVFYTLSVTVIIGLGYLYLVQFYKSSINIKSKKQTMFVIVGTLVASSTGFLTNLILPFYGIFDFNWMSQITVMFMVISIAIAILKYQLFNLKVFAAQVFVFTLWVFLLVRVFISNDTKDRIVDVSLLLLTIFIGVLLIKSIQREIVQKDIQLKLANDLKNANYELQKLDQIKTEFLSLASHQLRTPVTAIKGYSSMILEENFGKLTKKLRDPVEKIFSSSSTLAALISDLLDVSKIEQGGMKYEMILFSMLSLVQSVVDEQKLAAKNKNLLLKLEVDNRHKYAVKGDQLKIRQVIQNLVDNSIKYTEKGSVTVFLGYDQNKKIVVRVKDTGAGMNKETLDKLFQKFSRGDVGGKTNTSGSGLGLYLAYQIVKAHAGVLRAESDGPSKGSTFIVELPTIY